MTSVPDGPSIPGSFPSGCSDVAVIEPGCVCRAVWAWRKPVGPSLSLGSSAFTPPRAPRGAVPLNPTPDYASAGNTPQFQVVVSGGGRERVSASGAARGALQELARELARLDHALMGIVILESSEPSERDDSTLFHPAQRGPPARGVLVIEDDVRVPDARAVVEEDLSALDQARPH